MKFDPDGPVPTLRFDVTIENTGTAAFLLPPARSHGALAIAHVREWDYYARDESWLGIRPQVYFFACLGTAARFVEPGQSVTIPVVIDLCTSRPSVPRTVGIVVYMFGARHEFVIDAPYDPPNPPRYERWEDVPAEAIHSATFAPGMIPPPLQDRLERTAASAPAKE